MQRRAKATEARFSRFSPVVLETRSLSVRYDDLPALRSVSISVRDQIVGVIGPKNAGKRTLLDAISGFVRPWSGSVWFRGADITSLPAHRRAALGICRTFEGLVAESTVRENILLAHHLRAGYSAVTGLVGAPRSFERETALRDHALETLDLLGLSQIAERRVASLDFSYRRRVEIAVAVAAEPDLLLVHEPGAGTRAEESGRLASDLRALSRRAGFSMVVSDSHVPLVLDVADYVYCLSRGEVVASGTPSEVRDDPDVIRAVMGA